MPQVATESEMVLLVKLGGLGDVVRTTGLLRGLKERWNRPLAWLTSEAATELIRYHPLVDQTLSLRDAGDAIRLVDRPWAHVISLEECVTTCQSLALTPDRQPRLSGVYYDGHVLCYTDDLSSWFDMSMISRHGRTKADALKRINTRTYLSHLTSGLAITPQRPSIHLLQGQPCEPAESLDQILLARADPDEVLVGVNTGAGPVWPAKGLAVSSTLELVGALNAGLFGRVTFVLLGGARESQRNASLCATLTRASPPVRALDATTSSIAFCSRVVRALDVLLTSDSFAMHLGLAMEIPTIAFFTVTSPLEIDLWDTGIAVELTSPYNRSYRRDLGPLCIDIKPLVHTVFELLPRTRNVI